MDRALAAFRRAASEENRERSGLRLRYSTAARQRAIAYWQQQRCHGVGVRRIAAAITHFRLASDNKS